MISDADLMGDGMESGAKLATYRLYVEKISPFNHAAYGKNVFLNSCIEELYMKLENKKTNARGHIEHMKKHIERLDEYAQMAADLGEDGVDHRPLGSSLRGARRKRQRGVGFWSCIPQTSLPLCM